MVSVLFSECAITPLCKNATPLETTTFSMMFGALTLIILSVIFEHPSQAIAMAPITALGYGIRHYLFYHDCLFILV